MKLKSIPLTHILIFAAFFLVFAYKFIFHLRIDISSDGLSYYAWLSSLVIDGDLNVYDEATYHNPFKDPITAYGKLPTGYTHNVFSIGPALLWLPFYLVGHLWAQILHYPLNGYSFPYKFMTVAATSFYVILGVLLTYRNCLKFFSPGASMLAALAVWVTQPMVTYYTGVPSMSHGMSFFAVSFFLFTFLRLSEERFSYILMGFAAGLMMLVRWQNIIFLLLPGSLLVTKIFTSRGKLNFRFLMDIFSKYGLAAIICLVTFLPQMVVWKVVYGSALVMPQGKGFMNWTDPQLFKSLWNPEGIKNRFIDGDMGLFYLYPIYAIALGGIIVFVLLTRQFRLTFSIILCFLAVWYVNSSVAGHFFMGRRYSALLALLSLGLAAIVSLFNRWVPRLLMIFLSLLGYLWFLLFNEWGLKIVSSFRHVNWIIGQLVDTTSNWGTRLKLLAYLKSYSSPPVTNTRIIFFFVLLCIFLLVALLIWKSLRPKGFPKLAFNAVLFIGLMVTSGFSVYCLNSWQNQRSLREASASLRRLTIGENALYAGSGWNKAVTPQKPVSLVLKNKKPANRVHIVLRLENAKDIPQKLPVGLIQVSTLHSGYLKFQLLYKVDIAESDRKKFKDRNEYPELNKKVTVETELLPPGKLRYLKTISLTDGVIPTKITIRSLLDHGIIAIDGIALEQVVSKN